MSTRRLTRAATSDELPGFIVHEAPIAQAGNYYDAANGTVRRNLMAYAYGRAPHDSPAGWRRYLLSIDLYSEFVSHELTREIFDAEWGRLTTDRDEAPSPPPVETTAQPDEDGVLPALGRRLSK